MGFAMQEFRSKLLAHAGLIVDRMFPHEDWHYEVANGDTCHVFAEWQSAKIEVYVAATQQALACLLLSTSRAARKQISAIDYSRQVLNFVQTAMFDPEASIACLRAYTEQRLNPAFTYHPKVMELWPEISADIERLCTLGFGAIDGNVGTEIVQSHIEEMQQRLGVSPAPAQDQPEP